MCCQSGFATVQSRVNQAAVHSSRTITYSVHYIDSMAPAPLTDLSRLCIHTITTKPWPIEAAVEHYAGAGVSGISVWSDAIEGRSAEAVGRLAREAGLEVVAYVRGGFFPHTSGAERTRAIDANKTLIDEAHSLGAGQLVLVCGAHPGQSLDASRAQIESGIEAILPHADAALMKLSIEPLHPMYADTRSAINTLEQANRMAERIDSPLVGVAVDVYHVWWDPHLPKEIERCASRGNLFAFHVCDWRNPTRDFLNDRELMGRGCIDVPSIRATVESHGFDGFIEVEIFSQAYWQEDQGRFLRDIIQAYKTDT